MEIKFTAVFEHKFDTGQLLRFPSILNDAWPSFKDLWPTFEIVDRSDDEVMARAFWNWRESGEDTDLSNSIYLNGELYLDGPCGFEARISQNMAVICHGTQWQDFVDDPTVQFIMNETCRLFANVFQVEQWLYMPDCQLQPSRALDVVKHGKTLPELARWLEDQNENTNPKDLDITNQFFLEHV